MTHATIIQHTAADSPATLVPILEKLGVATTVIRLDRADEIPTSISGEILMTFGAPISLLEKNVPNWVQKEEELLRCTLEQDKAVLGVCFGAQLLASVLGGGIVANQTAEVGWHRVWKSKVINHPGRFLNLPNDFNAFHWHRNRFEIPEGATRLYQSEACENQAFQWGERVAGFQFHFEANEKTVRSFLLASDLWKIDSKSVQGREEIFRQTKSFLETQQMHLEEFMREFVSRSS